MNKIAIIRSSLCIGTAALALLLTGCGRSAVQSENSAPAGSDGPANQGTAVARQDGDANAGRCRSVVRR